ncbi:anti-repressor SinI family protein [Ectobacillus funiculus]
MENIKLDKNWLSLLKDLQELGVSKEQFKKFVETKKHQNKNRSVSK